MDNFFVPFEVKLAANDTEKMSFSGHGAVFGNVDAYGDVIAPGAFTKTLKDAKNSGQWPAMLMQHGGFGMTAEDMMPIGVWTALEEDNIGLKASGVLADTTKGRDTYTLLKMQPRPAINGLSIGYLPIRWKARSRADEPRRTLEEVKLMEISLVTFPANTEARVRSVKAMEVDLGKAIRSLGKSIKIHEGHMDGSIDTSEESQQEMMDLMNEAHRALTNKKPGSMGGMKNIEKFYSLSDVENYLRDACGFSRSEAVAFVSRVKRLGQSESVALSEVRSSLLRRGMSISTK